MDLLGDYIGFTNGIAHWAGATHEMMHVHCGIALYLALQLMMRTRRASLLALAIVVTAAIAHEAAQRLYYGDWRWEDTLGDVALTIMWPAAITFVGLYRRARWRMDHIRHYRRVVAFRLRTSPAGAPAT